MNKVNQQLINYVLLILINLCLILGLVIVNTTYSPYWISNVFRFLSIVIALIYFLLNKFFLIKKSVFLLLAISFLYIFFTPISLNLFFVFIFSIFIGNTFSRVHINSFFISLVVIVCTIFLFIYFGIIKNEYDVNTNIASELLNLSAERLRFKFGFNNPNTFATIFTSLIFIIIFLNRKLLFLSGFICYYIYYLTDSKSLIMTYTIIVLLDTFFTFFSKSILLLRIISYTLVIIPVGLVFLLLVTPQIIPNEIDLLLSGRITNIISFFDLFNPINYILGGVKMSIDFAVDNTFALFIGTYGVGLFLFFLLRFVKVLDFFIVNQKLNKLTFMISYFLYSFSESNLFRPETLASLVFWFFFLYPDKDINS
jgi:hypothetical protein